MLTKDGTLVVKTGHEINDTIQEPILPMIECIKSNDSLTGAVIPVACGPRERNVTMPLLFALCHGIETKATELAEKLEQETATASAYQAKANEWFGIAEWWRGFNGQETYAQKTAVAMSAAERQYAALEPLIEPISLLELLLAPLDRF